MRKFKYLFKKKTIIIFIWKEEIILWKILLLQESVLGNMVGGMVSGFGIGTGIEAAKGLGDKIFGNKEYTQEKNTNNKANCQLLSDMINKCNQNNEYNNCDNLLKIFSEKCLTNQ